MGPGLGGALSIVTLIPGDANGDLALSSLNASSNVLARSSLELIIAISKLGNVGDGNRGAMGDVGDVVLETQGERSLSPMKEFDESGVKGAGRADR